MEVFLFFLCMSSVGILIALSILWKHNWDWRKAKKDLLDGSLVEDVEAMQREALEFAERAEKVGRKAKKPH